MYYRISGKNISQTQTFIVFEEIKMVEKSEKWTVIRFPKSLVEKLRQRFPELADESDAMVVRIAIRKYLEDTR